MIANFYFALGLITILMDVALLSKYKRYIEFHEDKSPTKFETASEMMKAYYAYTFLFEVPWSLLLFITAQWWISLGWILLGLLLRPISKRWYAFRRAKFIVSIFVTLFIIVNHFQLHITFTDFCNGVKSLFA